MSELRKAIDDALGHPVDAIEMLKGDVAGHEFHGNQFTTIEGMQRAKTVEERIAHGDNMRLEAAASENPQHAKDKLAEAHRAYAEARYHLDRAHELERRANERRAKRPSPKTHSPKATAALASNMRRTGG